jgi:hypothetical protein
VPEIRQELTWIKAKSETSSILSLGQSYQWYMSCRSNHRLCKSFTKIRRWCPTRLLDLGARDDPIWKLAISATDISTPPLYMTLSYTWGLASFLKLKTSNVDIFRRGQLISNLPQTYQDMIHVARRFSIRYIWIDSLCILQDSREDWERESSLMSDVYMNSSCNIAAVASTDPYGGLFRSRRVDDIQPGLVWSNLVTHAGQYYQILDKGYWNSQVSDTALHKRGWVFQERLLAPRTLHFSEHQILWECFSDQKCEAYPRGLPKPLENPILKPRFSDTATHPIDLWKTIVGLYSRCALTVSDDKLVALSGVAKVYQDATGEEHVAGLWKSCMIELMRWFVTMRIQRVYVGYRAPSWSWANNEGTVSFANADPYRAKVLDVQVDRSVINPTGQVYGGFIHLEAVVIPVLYKKNRQQSYYYLEISGLIVDDVVIYEDNQEVGGEDSCSEYYCVALGFLNNWVDEEKGVRHMSVHGLLVKLVLDTEDTYNRVGYFYTEDVKAIAKFGICIGPERREVTIDENVRTSQIRLE